jgi:hypothetical protein
MVGGWEWKSKWIKFLIVKKNPIKTVLKFILPFKNLRKGIRVYLQKGNTKKVKRMNPVTELWLKAYYKNDVERLSHFLNRNLNHWTL